MLKCNLDNFLYWCKENTEFNNDDDIATELGRLYLFKQKNPNYTFNLSENEQCNPYSTMINYILQYINHTEFDDELLIGEDEFDNYIKQSLVKLTRENVDNPEGIDTIAMYYLFDCASKIPNCYDEVLYPNYEFGDIYTVDYLIKEFFDDFEGYENKIFSRYMKLSDFTECIF